MAERKSFLLRMDRELLDAVQRWANDDLRSLNGQIEFLLRRALQDTGRVPRVARSSEEKTPGVATESTAESATETDSESNTESPNSSDSRKHQ